MSSEYGHKENKPMNIDKFSLSQSLDTDTNAFYASPEFKAKASEYADFFNAIRPFLDQRPDDLEDMVSVKIGSDL